MVLKKKKDRERASETSGQRAAGTWERVGGAGGSEERSMLCGGGGGGRAA